jgi:hypothetical protein
MLTPEKRIDIRSVMDDALLAFWGMYNYPCHTFNKQIEKMIFHEVRSHPFSTGEFTKGLRFFLPVYHMTERHFLCFLYMFFCAAFRNHKLVKKSEGFLLLSLENVFWRDFLLFLMNIFGLRQQVRITRKSTFVTLETQNFSNFVAYVFQKIPDIPFRDFRMARRLALSKVLTINAKGEKVPEDIDKIAQPSIEQLEYSVLTATCPGITFPELSENIEVNSLFVRTHEDL